MMGMITIPVMILKAQADLNILGHFAAWHCHLSDINIPLGRWGIAVRHYLIASRRPLLFLTEASQSLN